MNAWATGLRCVEPSTASRCHRQLKSLTERELGALVEGVVGFVGGQGRVGFRQRVVRPPGDGLGVSFAAHRSAYGSAFRAPDGRAGRRTRSVRGELPRGILLRPRRRSGGRTAWARGAGARRGASSRTTTGKRRYRSSSDRSDGGLPATPATAMRCRVTESVCRGF